MSQMRPPSAPLPVQPNPRSTTKREFDAWIPKSIVCLREGYSRGQFLNDLAAGVTVGVVALPLAMAFAINSGPGLSPQMGLYTAIIAGFLVSALGGSRVQIAGPTGAFMPILYLIVQRHGYDGLCVATVMAGAMLILLGLFKLGRMIKFIPYPVTTGFTAGIAVIIFSSQMKDFFGLTMDNPPPDFVGKWYSYLSAFHAHGANLASTFIAAGGLTIIIAFRKFAPRIPGAIIAVVLAGCAVTILHLDDSKIWGDRAIATIGTKFGGISRQLPTPHFGFLHAFTFQKVRELIPEATTIALLAAIESLLCCVVADGMIGGRHKSNLELVTQGIANIASIFFGGIPATGAIARTAVNVKSGGRTPFAGIIHSFFVLLCMLLLAPLAAKIPMAVFASVLVMVAWNMSERDHFAHLFRAPRADILVLLTTFGLTVLTDLTVAVGVGFVLAAMLFMKRMSEVTNVGALDRSDEHDQILKRGDLPRGVEVYEINGPFFFGVAERLMDTLHGLEKPPRVFILRMRRVPAIDASGMHALDEFLIGCRKRNTQLLLEGVHAQPMFALTNFGLIESLGEQYLVGDLEDALNRARQILGEAAV